MGFHEATIHKGEYGQLSKIREELEEAEDAEARGQMLMLRIELSDILGAVKGVSDRLGMDFNELLVFAELRSKVAREEQDELCPGGPK